MSIQQTSIIVAGNYAWNMLVDDDFPEHVIH